MDSRNSREPRGNQAARARSRACCCSYAWYVLVRVPVRAISRGRVRVIVLVHVIVVVRVREPEMFNRVYLLADRVRSVGVRVRCGEQCVDHGPVDREQHAERHRTCDDRHCAVKAQSLQPRDGLISE